MTPTLNTAHASFTDVLVLPFQHPMVSPPPRGFRGGPVLPAGYDALRQHREGEPADSTYATDLTPHHLAGEFAYGGPIYHHFSHFLAEMVHRILPSRQYRPDLEQWLFVGAIATVDTLEQLPAFVSAVLEYLGIASDQVTIVTEPTVVQRLVITAQASDLGGGPHPGYVELLGNVNDQWWRARPPGNYPRRIYVARTSTVVGSYLGERYLASELAREGYVELRPETLSFDEQMAHYRSAESLLFAEGSAIHGTELLGRCLGDVGMISRRSHDAKEFRLVVEPRARSYAVAGGATYLGSVHRLRGAEVMPDGWGVSLLNPLRVRDDLRAAGLADLSGLTTADYADAAAADLEAYLALPEPHALAERDPSLEAPLREAFRATFAHW